MFVQIFRDTLRVYQDLRADGFSRLDAVEYAPVVAAVQTAGCELIGDADSSPEPGESSGERE